MGETYSLRYKVSAARQSPAGRERAFAMQESIETRMGFLMQLHH